MYVCIIYCYFVCSSFQYINLRLDTIVDMNIDVRIIYLFIFLGAQQRATKI